MLALSIVGLVVILVLWAVRRNVVTENRAIKGLVTTGIFAGNIAALALLGYSMFNGVFFYAEPGYKYHVRTIFGEEKMVSDTGYNTFWFGRYNAWKNAMSVQASFGGGGTVTAEDESAQMSANLPPKKLVFLDQVDADVSATARYLLPADEESFLLMARQYRTPENLLRTELVPAFEETLSATASLMSAEDYFQGGKTEFNIEFLRQMERGIYLVERREQQVSTGLARPGSANAALGGDQEEFGDDTKTVFVVEKILDQATNEPMLKVQAFTQFGVTVTSARVTHVEPNAKFQQRMRSRQDAAAARAIAREQRIQEEEQKLLAVARGEREVAERQAQAKVVQIERTTDAETEKQLALTAAIREREAARIAKEQAEILLEKARIDAEAVQVAADAEAYAKAQVLAADNALQAKLDAEIQIQAEWARAYATRQVPQTVFGSMGGDGSAPVGADSEAAMLLNIFALQAAERLDYDRGIATQNPDTRPIPE